MTDELHTEARTCYERDRCSPSILLMREVNLSVR